MNQHPPQFGGHYQQPYNQFAHPYYTQQPTLNHQPQVVAYQYPQQAPSQPTSQVQSYQPPVDGVAGGQCQFRVEQQQHPQQPSRPRKRARHASHNSSSQAATQDATRVRSSTDIEAPEDNGDTTFMSGAADVGEDDPEDEHNEEGEGAIFHIPAPPEQTFSSEEELEKFIHDWSRDHGYELVRRASKKNTQKEVYKRYYHCSRHGQKICKVSEADRKRQNRRSNRMDCPMSIATVATDPNNPGGEWTVRQRKSHHNHPPVEAAKLPGHRRRARIGPVEKAVDSLLELGTETSAVLKFLQTTHPEGLFKRADVANMKMKWKKHGTCADRQMDRRSAPSTSEARQDINDAGHEVVAGSSDNPQAAGREQQPLPYPKGVRSYRIGRPSAAKSAQTLEILEDLQASTQRPVSTIPLTIHSSAVQTLVNSCCGDGSSYERVAPLKLDRDWPDYRDAMIEASLKEGCYDVLIRAQTEPQQPFIDTARSEEASEIEKWNEYIKQLAIFRRRCQKLKYAFVKTLRPAHQNAIRDLEYKPAEAWKVLENLCAPRGAMSYLRIFDELCSLTLSNCSDLTDYVGRFQKALERLNSVQNTVPPYQRQKDDWNQPAMSDGFVTMVFLKGLGAEWHGWVEMLGKTCNLAGYGTGDYVGFEEVRRRTMEHEARLRQPQHE